MAKKILAAGSLFLLIACVLYGCSNLQKSSKNLDVSIASTTNDSQYITYVFPTVTSSVEVQPDGAIVPAALSATVTSRLLYSTNARSFVTPQISFNRIQVKYSVAMDTKGILAGWSPTALDSGVNIVIPRSTAASAEGIVSSTTTINLKDVASYNNGLEVFDKIAFISETNNGDGTFTFRLDLLSQVVVKADITLSGADEYGNPVSATFSTSIDYVKSVTNP